MTLIRTSLLNGIAVVVKMLTLLGINKVLAIYVGPAGYAVLGQFQNAVQMLSMAASGSINNGVIKYTAAHGDDPAKQLVVWRTAGSISVAGSLLVGLFIAIFRVELATWFLKDPELAGVFVWLAATLVLFSLNTLLLAILNGKKEIGRYVIANIAGSVFALGVTCVMVLLYGLYGALVSLAIYQSISFFVTAFLCLRAPWFRLDALFGIPDRQVAINLAKYSAMALTSAACVPISHMLVRNHLGETISWEAAGYWEAMWRLSAAYLMLVTTTLSVYYLPRLSELVSGESIRREVLQGYKLILPVAAVCGIGIFIFRDLIITLLFTDGFSPMRELFAWQMLGDTLKIGSWVLGYVMLGRAMTKMFIATEIIFSGSFYLLVVLFTSRFELQGVAIAYAANYVLYWVTLYWLVFRRLDTGGEHAG